MSGIKDYSSTAGSNTSIGGISIAEGMLPSNINDAFRGLTADIREWYNDSQWVIYGDGDSTFTIAYASATSFTVSGVNVTSFYHVGRRIKAIGSSTGTIYGSISATTFSTNTTVTVTWDSGSLSNETLTIYVGVLSKTNSSIPDAVIGSTNIADSSVTTAKIADTNVTAAKLATTLDLSGKTITFPTGIPATNIGGGLISNTEFSYLDGVTSAIQTQIDSKQATITGGASSIASSNLTVSKALASDGSGKVAASSVTATELGYVSGVTSALQTQIDSKQATLTGATTTITSSNLTASKAVISNSSGKIAVSTTSDTELGYVSGVTSAIQTQLDAKLVKASNLSDLTSASTARTNLGLGTIATQNASSVTLTGGTITGLGDPSASSDAATKNYVDNLVTGLRTRVIARVASTANVVIASGLENGDVIDGVTLVTGNRVLLKNQTTTSQNGLYTVVASGTASRDTEFDIISEIAGQLILVSEGTTNADLMFLCTTDTSATLGSSAISYTQVFPSSGGTVTSVGISGSEFTIGSSPVTSSGTITLAVNSIANTKISGLGTASTLNVGTSANNIVQLTAAAKLPAVDGSLLTSLSPTQIDANVSATEFGYLDGVTSSIQTQLTSKPSAGFVIAMSIAL
jgi:hypothetical protein